MTNWNRIGQPDVYTATVTGSEIEWKAKKREIEGRGHTIIREGVTAPTPNKPAKYWAKVQMPKR